MGRGASPRSTAGSRRSSSEHGRDAVGAYLGNPNAHNLDALLYGRALVKALGTRNVFSATTVDQMPKHVSAGLMFGTRAQHPGPRRRPHRPPADAGRQPAGLERQPADRARHARPPARDPGARRAQVVVVDPRRSRTAEDADEHHFIRPGHRRAPAVRASLHVTCSRRASPTSAPLAEHVRRARRGAGARRATSRPRPRREACGIDAGEIRRMARELAAAERAAVYGRIGTCTQEFGTLASWLVDVLNVVTGNLDRPGGAMFTKAAAGASNTRGTPGKGKGIRVGRWHTRVRGLPEALGELPGRLPRRGDRHARRRPGPGAVHASPGNPVVSTPNAGRLRRALESLDLMVSVDIYVNETTRHADVILPAPSPLYRSHYDLALYQLAARNVANYSPAVLELDDSADARVADAAAAGRHRGRPGPRRRHRGVRRPRDRRPGGSASSRTRPRRSPAATPEELLAALEPRRGPERMLDWMLRTGPYGDHFGANPGRPHAGEARGGAARHRPRPARAAHPRGAAHGERQDRAGAGADRRRRRPACGRRWRATATAGWC